MAMSIGLSIGSAGGKLGAGASGKTNGIHEQSAVRRVYFLGLAREVLFIRRAGRRRVRGDRQDEPGLLHAAARA
jgi:hypothetical protein